VINSCTIGFLLVVAIADTELCSFASNHDAYLAC
jgi:hypothetical protein